jgi:hypothetical protein
MVIWKQNFLKFSVDGGEWSASRPGSITTKKGSLGIRRIRGWVDSRTGLDNVERGKIFPLPLSAVQPIASRYTDSHRVTSILYFSILLHSFNTS